MTTPRGPSSSTAIQQVRTLLVYIYLYCNLHESWQLTIVNEVRLVARGGALLSDFLVVSRRLALRLAAAPARPPRVARSDAELVEGVHRLLRSESERRFVWLLLVRL